MKRTRLTRKTPLDRSDGFRAPRTPMKRSKGRRRAGKGSNAKKEERWELQYRSEDFVMFVKSLPCVRCGTRSDIEVHHDPPRSRGGAWKDTSPLCKWECHPKRHSDGEISFWRELGTTYARSNADTHAKWLGVAPVAQEG